MSKIYGENYTMRVDEIIDQIWNDDHPINEEDDLEIPTWKQGLQRINERIAYASPIIFDFEYPCYGGEDERKALQEHILRTYYTRNICSSSMIRWVLFLQDRMHDIMPKYVEMYKAQVQLIASDILNPYHVSETKNNTYDKNKTSSNESKSNVDNLTQSQSNSHTKGIDDTDTKEVSKFSNTPQALASAVESGESIPLNYLSTMGINDTSSKNNYESGSDASDNSKASTTSNDESNYNSSEKRFEELIRDTRGNLSKMNNAQLIKDYDDAILNIELMISNELKDLFYLMY